jgi:hypothetical protein
VTSKSCSNPQSSKSKLRATNDSNPCVREASKICDADSLHASERFSAFNDDQNVLSHVQHVVNDEKCVVDQIHLQVSNTIMQLPRETTKSDAEQLCISNCTATPSVCGVCQTVLPLKIPGDFSI